MDFKVWLENDLRHIKVPLPSVRQCGDFDCGAACLRSVCQLYKVGPEKESDFIKAVSADKKKGTKPENIVKAATLFGLKVKLQEPMKLEILKAALDAERPVICNIQAWGDPKGYKDREYGHYVVAIGYDDKRIYFEDPKMRGRRGFLTYKDFDRRWHDWGNGRNTNHLGIVLWKQTWDRDSRYLLKSGKIK